MTLLGFESILPNFLLNGAVTKVLLGSRDRKYLKSSTYYVYFDSNKSKTDFHSACSVFILSKCFIYSQTWQNGVVSNAGNRNACDINSIYLQ